MRKSFDNTVERRIIAVLLFFFLSFAILLGRLFVVQIINHPQYVKLASRQHRSFTSVSPERGSIFAKDKQGNPVPLAINKIQKNLIVVPKNIEDKNATAEYLAKATGISKDDITKKIADPGDPYEIITKKLDDLAVQELSHSDIKGVILEEERHRLYPQGNHAAHLLGFVSGEAGQEIGRYGLERFYNRDLIGMRGFLENIDDSAGFWMALGKSVLNPSANGSDVYLTIDFLIQQKAEEVLSATAKKWSAQSGLVLVMEPSSGKILAEAALPSYNPNEFSKEKNFSVFLNPLTEAIYEFGSVIKPVVMAAAIEEKVVSPDTTYDDGGEIRVGGYKIKNFDGNAYGTQTMSGVIEKSLNLGMVFVSKKLGKEKQKAYFRKFGFGEKSGIDLPGEVVGNITNLQAGRDIDYATSAFGQGIALTPIQVATAISVLANGGVLMRPWVTEKIIKNSGFENIKQSEVRSRVVSKETAETLTKMLVSAVKNGYENRAGVRGYFVAGKTGTAQIPRADGKGYSDDVVHTFVGYAPAFHPRFLVLLQLNRPTGNRFAANTLTPAFHDLAEFILNYLEIPPDEK